MPNPWGANVGTFAPFYTQLIGSANVSCPANTETNVVNVTGVAAYGPGNWTPGFLGVLGVSLGATPPTSLVVAARINNGADVSGITVPPAMLVASASLMIPICLWNFPSSTTLWNAPGATFQMSVNPGGQAVTALNVDSAVYYWLLRVGE